jgi:hypothetical protein
MKTGMFVLAAAFLMAMAGLSSGAQETNCPESAGPQPDAYVFIENFDSYTAPPWPANGWEWARLDGTSTEIMFNVQAGMGIPSGTPHSLPNVLRFNSYNLPAGNKGMLRRTSGVDLSAYGGIPVKLMFYMYHDTQYSGQADSLQVVVNIPSGGPFEVWQNIGPVIYRYRAGSDFWALHTQDLSAYGGVPELRVGFICASEYGSNIFIDDVGIYTGGPDLDYQYVIPVDDVCVAAGSGQHDGAIDPGETVTWDVVLRNNGNENAAGISATLTTTTPGVTVTGANSSYPDIAASANGTNSAHFAFRAGDSVACGTVIDMNLRVTADNGFEWDFPLTPMTGSPEVIYQENFEAMTAGALPAPWTSEVISGQQWNINGDGMAACSPPISLRYPNNTAAASDSWAYMPPQSLAAGTVYTLSYKYSSWSSAEVFGVYAGNLNSHANMTIPLVPDGTIDNMACLTRHVHFTVPSTGMYYIGFHAAGLPGGVQMNVDDIVLFEQACNPCFVCPAITLSPAALPSGIRGRAYSQTISASGGTAPYTYDVSSVQSPPKFLLLDPSTGVLSGIPAAAGTYPFTVTATDSTGCPGSLDYSLTILAPPGAPVITNIADADPCAQTGITITFTAGTPATRHDLYRDGALYQSNVASPTSYNPGDTASHSYVIRAVNTDDACFTDSAPAAFTDPNLTPSKPAITNITDPNPMAFGLVITYSAGTPAARHDLYKDGVPAASGFMSGGIYMGSDSLAHSYTIAAVNGACMNFSDPVIAADAGNVIHPPRPRMPINPLPFPRPF